MAGREFYTRNGSRDRDRDLRLYGSLLLCAFSQTPLIEPRGCEGSKTFQACIEAFKANIASKSSVGGIGNEENEQEKKLNWDPAQKPKPR